MNYEKLKDRLHYLPIWKGDIVLKQLNGGMNNITYYIADNNNEYVAKLGGDLVDFHISRAHEIKATNAAFKANIAPNVVYYEDGITVFNYIKSSHLSSYEMRKKEIMKKIISLIKIVHSNVKVFYDKPTTISWYFELINKSIYILKKNKNSDQKILDGFLKDLNYFVNSVGDHNIVFTHNDFVSSNILNDGNKLWLIDWEYSGYNFDLVDLANLSKNNLFSEEQDIFILEEYYESKKEENILLKNFNAFKCIALLREVLWSMTAEIKSKIEYDYKSYTENVLNKYNLQLSYFNKF
tara:strand:- start:132 stop:1016 length:885 start_codon:yes stop_codon:yes gene_type:complete